MLEKIIIGIVCFIIGGNIGVLSMALLSAAKED